MAFDLDEEGPTSIATRGSPAAGIELGRLLALSDGVFAFALTLLVINLVVPSTSAIATLPPGQGSSDQLAQYLLSERSVFFSYGLAFFIVGTWWLAHHRLFSLVGRGDRPLLSMNLAFLLFIAVTPFDVGLLALYGDTSTAVGFYAATQALAGGVLFVMWQYVGRRASTVLLPGAEPATVHHGRRLAVIAPIGFLISIPVALFSPTLAIGMWFGIFAVRAAADRWRGRDSPRLRAPPEPGAG